MPKRALYSASEIASMRLAGLPTTKARVIERAASEGWYWEERTGLGGRRKVYDVPGRYLAAKSTPEAAQTRSGELLEEATTYIKEQRKSGEFDDAELIREVVLGVERWLERNKLQPDPEKKAALISLLFKYFKEDQTIDDAKLDKLLRAVA